MKNLRYFYSPLRQINKATYGIDVRAGANIINVIAEAITLSMKKKRKVKFTFNGEIIRVSSDSNPDLIHRDWLRALSGYIDKSVGPYPNPVLTDEERASDALIESKNEEASQKRQAEYEAKAKIHRERVESKLVNAPDIELADEDGWKEFKTVNSDGYGGAVVSCSERWARLMQVEIANGRNLEDVADATFQEADLEGITGFQYGHAVLALSHCWKHGEQLRRWHNLETQLGNEGVEANESGGVLNPALLSIG